MQPSIEAVERDRRRIVHLLFCIANNRHTANDIVSYHYKRYNILDSEVK